MRTGTCLAVLLTTSLSGTAFAACSDRAEPGVDWKGCDFQSARLAGSDLRGAILQGADFRDADLRGADLEGADILGADFSHADLSRTIWIDGRECGIGSDGECY